MLSRDQVDNAIRRRLLDPADQPAEEQSLQQTEEAAFLDPETDSGIEPMRRSRSGRTAPTAGRPTEHTNYDFLGAVPPPLTPTTRRARWKRLWCWFAICLGAFVALVGVLILATITWTMGRKRFIAATRKLPPLNDIAVTIPLMDEKRWQRFWKGQYTYSGQRGYFGVYMGSASWNKTRNHVLLEVPFAELERPFVIDALFTRGDADAFLLHSPAKQVSQNWFAFRLSESRPTRTLDVYRPQLDVRIQTNVSELARSYAAGTWTGWEKSLPLVAIVQPNTTMTRSWRRVPKSLNDTLGWRLIVGISPWVSDGFSVLFPDLSKKAAEAKTQAAVPKWTWRTVDAKAFPRNVQVRLQAMITRTEQASDWNPQQRFAAEISFQLIRLPEDPLSLRLADERIGYFTTSFLLLDHDQGLHERIDVINRRRLPVVYHIDPTVPRRWRPYLKKGVENWQTAFEQAGWEASGAGQEPPIRAVLPEDDDWPLDYDIADVRFNTISWSPSLGSVFALGPSSTDPRTGEILNSHIIFTHGWIRSIMRQYTNLVAAQQRMSCRNGTDRLARRRSREWTLTPLELPSSPPSISRIHHVDEARLDIPAFAILESLALVSDLGDVPERFIGESLTDTTMHEVGHTLGLRHNFRASANVRWQALSDSAYVERHGITSSVMDYVPILIFADSRKQTRYFQHVLGAYDMMAIRYGYGPRQTLPETSPERSTLNLRVAIDEALAEHRTELATLAQQAVEKGLHFGTDEDDPSPAGVDVYVSQWDLSDDPLQYHENVVQLLERIVPRLRTLVHQRDLSWADYTELVRYAIIFASRSALYTTKFFGSIELRRSHPADLTATRTTVQVPRKPVDAETMQQALALLRRLLSPLEPGAFLGGNGGNDEHGYSQWTQELVEESGQCKGLETYCLGLRPVPVLDLLRRTRHQVLSLALDPKRLTRLRENAQLQRIATLPLNTYLAAWTEMFFGNGSTEVLRTMSPFALDAQADYVLMLRETLQNMTKTNEDPVAILAITYELRRLHCLVHSVLHKLGHAAEKETTDETYRVHLVGLSSLLSNRFPPLNESGVFNAATVPCPQFG